MLCTILIVDDDPIVSRLLSAALQNEGYQASVAHDAGAATKKMAELHPDVVLMDLMLPDADGSELMIDLKQRYPDTAFIIITGYGSIRSATQSTRNGAIDYLTKPFEIEEVVLAVRNAMKSRATEEEVHRLRDGARLTGRTREETDTWQSGAMREVITAALQAAKQDGIVLLLGESGTGKGVLARWIHDHSNRSTGPFFSINCAALPRDLAESELFGHEPGAFTGTRGRKRGLLELAEKGTLLLDEIGEMDAQLQAKLLSFLDTRSFVRLGGERSIRISARIIAATNVDLVGAVERGVFRRDLYYRLNVFPIQLPALRDRTEDLPALVERVLDRLVSDLGLSRTPSLGRDVQAALCAYSWPGNIRELRNVLERALMLSHGRTLTPADLGLTGSAQEWKYVARFPEVGTTLHDLTREFSRQLISEALRRAGNKLQAARLLGISRHALNHQMRALGMLSSSIEDTESHT